MSNENNHFVKAQEIKDSFRWLEDVKDPKVQTWIADQNTAVDKVLRNKNFDIFSAELAKNFKVNIFSNPVPVHGRYFYTERQPDQDQSVLYMKIGLNGTPIELVNPNGLKKGNTITLDSWSPSRRGNYVIYGLSEGGDEMSTLYIKNTDSNENLKEQIAYCRHSSMRWLPDDSGFFYTRNPRPGTVPKNEEHLHTKVYFHKLGDNPDTDELIFGEGRPKDDMIGLSISLDGRYLAIGAAQKWTEEEIHIYDRTTKELRPLVVGIPSKFSLRFLSDKVLIDTDYKANNRRIMYAPLDDFYKPIDQW